MADKSQKPEQSPTQKPASPPTLSLPDVPVPLKPTGVGGTYITPDGRIVIDPQPTNPTGARATYITPDGRVVIDPQPLRLAVPEPWQPEALINSTGTVIGGTISSLDALDATMNRLQQVTLSGLQPALDAHLGKFVEPLKTDLEAARTQLQDARTNLSNIGSFIKDNQQALTDLITAKGRMAVLEAETASLVSRVGKLEIDKNTAWNQTATILSLVLAAVALCATASGVLLAALALVPR